MPHFELEHSQQGGMGQNMPMHARPGTGMAGVGAGGGGANVQQPFSVPDANVAAMMAAAGITPERLHEMMRAGLPGAFERCSLHEAPRRARMCGLCVRG